MERLLSSSARAFARLFLWSLLEHYLARSISRGSLSRQVQRLEKCDECGRLRWTQVFPIRRHVAASLNHLPDELVLREPHRNAVQGRASFPAGPSKGMAVAALFDLKNESALPLKRSCALEHPLRHGITAPSVHVRAPRCELREMGKGPERDRDQHIFPHGIGNEGCAIPLRQFMVFAFISSSFHKAPRHRPFVDA